MGNIIWRSQGSSEDADSLQEDLDEDTGTNRSYIDGILCLVAINIRLMLISPLIVLPVFFF